MRTPPRIALGCLLVAAPSGQGADTDLRRVPEARQFFVHDFHANRLGVECSVCHVPMEQGSVELARPGHDHCMLCHERDYLMEPTPVFCGQCHSDFPALGSDALLPFPLYRRSRPILFGFSHEQHLDPERRIDGKTGFRADCTYCHHFDEDGVFAKFPMHEQCAACHADPGIPPHLASGSRSGDCRGCHVPERIENPAAFADLQAIPQHVIAGVYDNLRFSHVAHFRVRDEYDLDCVRCHSAVEESTGLADLSLPDMLDCVGCHDTDRGVPESLRISSCSGCHLEERNGPVPASHSRNVKPPSHNESFRVEHSEPARAIGAKCYACHLNVSPSASAADQCASCHQAMRPTSHTARWRDTVHGKFAAMDRTSCAICHVADMCIRCHNQIPRSHQPLPQFMGHGHAALARLEQRACFTCHQFEDSCAKCHLG